MRVAATALLLAVSWPVVPPRAFAQSQSYAALRSEEPLRDRIAYVLTSFEASPDVRAALRSDPAIAAVDARVRATAAGLLAVCEASDPPRCPVEQLMLSDGEVNAVAAALERLAADDPAVARLAARHLRPSGRYQLHAGARDPELLGLAWRDAARAVNRLYSLYALGEKPLYPAIDSLDRNPKDGRFQARLGEVVAMRAALDALPGGGERLGGKGFGLEGREVEGLGVEGRDVEGRGMERRGVEGRGVDGRGVGGSRKEQGEAGGLFAAWSGIGFDLLTLAQRDEAARYEPLDSGANGPANAFARKIRWKAFRYSAILVPGSGPEAGERGVSPIGVLRLQLAVRRWREGLAPLIILSGGHVHPNRSEFSEAAEMKTILMTRFGLPEKAILIDPYARHTTTNLRNAVRLLFRAGAPMDRPFLVTSSPGHAAYVADAGVDGLIERSKRELGYMPYRDAKMVSAVDAEVLPNVFALQLDPDAPLDP